MIQSTAIHRRRQVLVVEDQELNRYILGMILEEDYDVLYAENGAEGVACMREHRETLSIVLLDLMMPGIDGYEVIRRLKSNPETAGIMILMVTALGELGDIERAVKAGCDDFLSKPVNQLELLKRIDNLLKLRNVTDELERLKQYIDSMEERK